jgi:hypothetical protein
MAIKAANIVPLFKEAQFLSKQPHKPGMDCEYNALATPEQRQERLQASMEIADRLINDEGSDLAGRFIPSVN